MDKIQFDKFNGNDFNVWKFQIESYFDFHGLLDIVNGSKRKPLQPLESDAAEIKVRKQREIEEWEKADKKARLVLGMALESNIVRQVMNLKTAAEMWSRLGSLYELKDPTFAYLLLQKFYKYEMAEGTSVAAHVAEVEAMARQLEDLGCKQSEVELVAKVLHSLPVSYRHVSSAFDSLPQNEQTLANLLPRLLKEEILSRGVSALNIKEDSGSSALYSKSTNSKGTGSDSQQHKKSKTKLKFTGSCHYCGKKGHKRNECRKMKQDSKTGDVNTADAGASCGQLLSAQAQFVAKHIEEDYVWLADSGATHHMTSHREWFTKYESISGDSLSITIGNSTVLYAAGRGQVAVDVIINGHKIRHILSDVLHVPGIKRNLFSIGAATDRGVEAKLGQRELKLFCNGTLIATGRREGNDLYCMDMRVPSTVEVNFNRAKPASLQTWHERLGHANYKAICELAKGKAVTGMVCNDKIKYTTDDDYFCEACVFGKQCRSSFMENEKRAATPGDTTWFDIMGPMSVDAIDGSRFLAQFVDDCTGVLVSSPIKSKAEIVDKLDEYLIMVKANGHTPHRIRSDNALEFDSHQMKALCRRHQVKHEFSAPYSPEQMGRIERQNRTSGEGIRTNLIAANLPLTLWNEVAKTVAYIRNRIPLKRLDDRTPYEAFTNNKPDIDHLRVLGSTAYTLIDKQHRKKLDSKSKRMVLVGYEPGSKAYRLWEAGTRRVIISRDVKFVEPEPKRIAALLPMTDKTKLLLPVEKNKNKVDREEDKEKIECEEPVGDNKPVATRTRSKVKAEANMAILLCAEAAPQSYKEAIESNNAEDWCMAMDNEMTSLMKNDTWKLVKLPPGRKAIRNKWIYRVKTRPDGSIERYKARLVIKGCSQQPGEDFNETFSPVARFESIRLLLAIAATRDCILKQIRQDRIFIWRSE